MSLKKKANFTFKSCTLYTVEKIKKGQKYTAAESKQKEIQKKLETFKGVFFFKYGVLSPAILVMSHIKGYRQSSGNYDVIDLFLSIMTS